MSWQGVKLTRLMSIFTSKKSLEIFDKNSADKVCSKKDRGWKVPSLMSIRVKCIRLWNCNKDSSTYESCSTWLSNDPSLYILQMNILSYIVCITYWLIFFLWIQGYNVKTNWTRLMNFWGLSNNCLMIFLLDSNGTKNKDKKSIC